MQQNTNNMIKRVILIGGAASGKDYLKSKLVELGWISHPSYTTRPIRPGEIDGETYHFVSDAEFEMMIQNKQLKQYRRIPGINWYYGTSNYEWENANIMIANYDGLLQLTINDISESLVVLMDPGKEIRKSRLISRADGNDTVNRRLAEDERQYAQMRGHNLYDLVISNPEFEIDDPNDPLRIGWYLDNGCPMENAISLVKRKVDSTIKRVTNDTIISRLIKIDNR